MKHLTFVLLILFCLPHLTTPARENEPEQMPVVYGNFVDETRSWATLGRLYVIIATDDNATDLEKIVRKNSELVQKTFQDNLAKGTASILKIPAENLSREMVFLLISNLPVRDDDAVFFYFCGRGGMDRKTGQYFHLSASGEDLFRSEVQAALNKRKHRLSVVVSDCCDAASGTNADDSKDHKTEESENGEYATMTSPLFFSLFFLGYGHVDLASSSSGQTSLVCENGTGCFTEIFVGLLKSNRRKKLSWTYLFPYFRDGTSSLFTQTYPEGMTTSDGIRQIDQVPVAFALGRKKVLSPMFDRFYPQGFDSVENMPESARDLTEGDRAVVTSLVRQVIGEIRPHNERDDDSHENVDVLDTDNVVCGVNGEPFSKKPEPVVLETPISDSEEKEKTDDDAPEPESPETPPEQKVRLGVQAVDNQGDGVRITNLYPDFPGKNAGLEVGDIILEINGTKITSEQVFSDAVDKADTKLEMLIRDGKNGRTVPLTIGIK